MDYVARRIAEGHSKLDDPCAQALPGSAVDSADCRLSSEFASRRVQSVQRIRFRNRLSFGVGVNCTDLAAPYPATVW